MASITNTDAIISLESDEEMESEPAPSNPVNDEALPKASENVEKVPDTSDSDIICIDDDDKETVPESEDATPAKTPSPAPAPASPTNPDTVPSMSVETESHGNDKPEPESINNEPELANMMETEDIEKSKDTMEDKGQKECQPCPEQQKQDEMDGIEDGEATTAVSNEPTNTEETVVDTKQSTTEEKVSLPVNGTADHTPHSNGTRRRYKCCNLECRKESSEYCVAPQFALNLYNNPYAKQTRYLCSECFEFAVSQYEKYCTLLQNGQPLLMQEMPKSSFEEIHMILDSSDEEDEEDKENDKFRSNDSPLPQDVISLIETELHDAIESMFKKCDLQQQMKWTTSILQKQVQENQESSNRIQSKLKELSNDLQSMYDGLYSIRTTKVDTPELIIEDDQTSERIAAERIMHMMQQVATFQREPVQVNRTYYGVRSKVLASWTLCEVIAEDKEAPFFTQYRVRFGRDDSVPHILSAKHLAYPDPPNVKLMIGTRVIAKPNSFEERAFFVGTVIEAISSYNRYRYLIIFDSGQAAYASIADVRVVCDQSKKVWEDVHPHSREFICSYMKACESARPMLQAKQGQRVCVEVKNKWFQAKVVETDSSLVRIYYPSLDQYEWIYRGSKRLAPLYKSNANGSQASNNKLSKFQKRNEPSIEYIMIDDDEDTRVESVLEGAGSVAHAASSSPQQPFTQPHVRANPREGQHRGTARKSTVNRSTPATAATPTSVVSLNRFPIYIDFDHQDRPCGSTVNFTTKNYPGPQKFTAHTCGVSCLYKITKNMKPYNLLARPLINGWERQVCKTKSAQKRTCIVYRGPCGRRIRNMYELHRYLRQTEATLNVDHFDFDPEIRALATFRTEKLCFECKDLSFGLECMPVHCVNSYDETRPPPCQYSTERIPTEGVNLNLDKEFLCGCDCEDDCSDKSRCQCWQLTLSGSKYLDPPVPRDEVGYKYKRLLTPILSGIYECNAQCKCRVDRCLNRVVQHPLQTKLQVFNTHNKGWGIRCLNDVPVGSFICIYAGHLLTEETTIRICEQNANKTGDEYFADLDFIETAELMKEHYEKEALPMTDDEDDWEVDRPRSSRADRLYEMDDDDDDESEEEEELRIGGVGLSSMRDSDEEYTTKSKPSDTKVRTRAQLRRGSSTTEKQQQKQKQQKQQKQKQQKQQQQPRSGDVINDEQECVSLIPNPETDPEANYESKFRKLFGPNEQIYVMDAKKSGNLGRYFNHSCVPNLFVQNVFVDTHDLRFPWVAFFAVRNIMAGTELTWNYNYDVGSVKGKTLTCNCGEKNCKGRLL
uniref:Histone-lysine N-methyltransferase n=1 Tax=Anopheles dirus TaxID=7168 RepID=A0A182NTK7_9DIPT